MLQAGGTGNPVPLTDAKYLPDVAAPISLHVRGALRLQVLLACPALQLDGSLGSPALAALSAHQTIAAAASAPAQIAQPPVASPSLMAESAPVEALAASKPPGAASSNVVLDREDVHASQSTTPVVAPPVAVSIAGVVDQEAPSAGKSTDPVNTSATVQPTTKPASLRNVAAPVDLPAQGQPPAKAQPPASTLLLDSNIVFDREHPVPGDSTAGVTLTPAPSPAPMQHLTPEQWKQKQKQLRQAPSSGGRRSNNR